MNRAHRYFLRQAVANIMTYDHWDRQVHEAWTLHRLRRLLRTAHRHIPYYRMRFREVGFSPDTFRGLEDIQRLPFVTKDDILAHGPDAFCDERIPAFLKFPGNTSGSTGRPCPVQGIRQLSGWWSQAFMAAQWGRIGYRVGDSIAVLRGRIVQRDGEDIYRFDYATNTLMLSTYHLRPERITEYIGLLNRYKIRYLHVYPSSLALFLDYCLSISSRPAFPYLQGVLCGSEHFMPAQRANAERVLGVPCYHWYGHSEMVLMGGWCEHEPTFHFFPQYGHLEVLRPDGTPVEAADEAGEVVGTGFRNPGMVLIRYRTNDVASGFSWGACGCGRSFPRVSQIVGRRQEYIIDTDGQRLPVTAFTAGLHLPLYECYRKFQLEQHAPGELIIRLERARHAVAHDRKLDASRQILAAAFQRRVRVEVVEVDEIPLMANGKHRHLIQHLKDL